MKEKELLDAQKEKLKKAWTPEIEKSFGLTGMLKFTWPRLWLGTCCDKFIVIFNFFLVIMVKATSVLVPLVIKEVIDSIICDRKTDSTCPSVNDTYWLIGLYAGVKFASDFVNYIREIPYANMAAKAEISIAHDVYDHVQRQCLAFHLNRETGKIIRMVSRGSQSFASVLRMLVFNLTPILLEIIFVLIIFGSLFSWKFLLL